MANSNKSVIFQSKHNAVRRNHLTGKISDEVENEFNTEFDGGEVSPTIIEPDASVMIPAVASQRIADIGGIVLIFFGIFTPEFKSGCRRNLK